MYAAYNFTLLEALKIQANTGFFIITIVHSIQCRTQV